MRSAPAFLQRWAGSWITCFVVSVVAATWVSSGCGEKITIPKARGIPSASLYVEQRPWDLTDPVDVLHSNGRIFVVEEATGTISKRRTTSEIQFERTGLANPVALGIVSSAGIILVGEAGDETTGPGISLFDQGQLILLGRIDLEGVVASLSGVTSDDEFIYVSDPDSAAVHRLEWLGDDPWTTPRGLVCNDRGSALSPRFVRSPQALALDAEGMLLICDADTLRNWVIRFDPAPPAEDPQGLGTPVVFRSEGCATEPPQSFVLGDAPDCEQDDWVAGPSSEPGGLHAPSGVAVDTDGRIYVADPGNQRTQRFKPDGRFDIVFGDGAGGVEPLQAPVRLTSWLGSTTIEGVPIIIPGARIYVVDREKSQLRVFEDKRWSDFEKAP